MHRLNLILELKMQILHFRKCQSKTFELLHHKQMHPQITKDFIVLFGKLVWLPDVVPIVPW